MVSQLELCMHFAAGVMSWLLSVFFVSGFGRRIQLSFLLLAASGVCFIDVLNNLFVVCLYREILFLWSYVKGKLCSSSILVV